MSNRRQWSDGHLQSAERKTQTKNALSEGFYIQRNGNKKKKTFSDK
jgi:hypothetical protein